MREVLDVTKALADETRLRLLCALAGGELCVCQLIELVALAPSTVSKHMAILRSARLVEARKDGRWVHYRLPDTNAPAHVRAALAWLRKSLVGDAALAADAQKLARILKMTPEELCDRQCAR